MSVKGKPKVVKNTKSPKVVKTTKTPKTSEVVKTTKSPKVIKPTKTPKSPKVVKTTKTPKTSEVVKTTKTPKTSEVVKTTKTIKRAKKVKLTLDDFKNNRYDLDGQSYIEYYPGFLTEKVQNSLITELTGSNSETYTQNNNTTVPWTHGIYKMFGKPIPTPRLLYAMRDKDVDITDSYTVTDSMPWTPEMKKLQKKVTNKTGKYCRYAQMNLYRDGNDYIGFHTDSEVRAGDLIASISLGAVRTFRFRSVDYKTEDEPTVYSMDLEPGSLLVMSEYAAKHNWKHELPKDKSVSTMRLNITFRPN